MNVRFQLRNVERVKKYLADTLRGTMLVGMRAIAEYILGNSQHGLRHNEPYRYVSRKAAYGQTFFSEKQRRWFWANGGPDMIGDHRTNKASEGWAYVETKGGYAGKFVNSTPDAYYTRDDYGQARQPALAGWRKVSRVISDNIQGAIRHANAEIGKYLKSKK